MVDFIEYVVAELKSKRLSKTNAKALVRQFSRRSPSPGPAAVVHPLLQRNTSDLSEQRYGSTFSGAEFFLTDHQVKANGSAAQRVLPGVAYLEMARAAIEDALPERQQSATLELLNTVWAQPVVVNGSRQVSIALWTDEEGRIDFEIYSQAADEEVVHCQGRAVFGREPKPGPLDLAQLEGEMRRGTMDPASLYAACAGIGLIYGPAFQAVVAIHQGSGQLLAHLRLPAAVVKSAADYVLHPSLMDGALQAAVGLMEGESGSSQPRMPFALETLRVVSPCTAQMAAWVRFAPGSQAADNVVKLDMDLCDERGNVCVQLRGFSSRLLGKGIELTATSQPAPGTLFATLVWQSSDLELSADTSDIEFAKHDVVLCELPKVELDQLQASLPLAHCLSLPAAPEKNIAERYADHALACFERIQAILQAKPRGNVLVQIAAAGDHEQALFAGLSALLKTAALENPRLIGQLVLVPGDTAAAELADRLRAEQLRPLDSLIRYEDGSRRVLRWQEVAADRGKAPIAFQDNGVYLITGGLGALGLLFAQEILGQTRQARVVLTGREASNGEIEARLDGLSAQPSRLSYRQVDLGDVDQIEQLITAINEEYGPLNGILHGAGMIADNFILKKTGSEFSKVLAPKVAGTFNLDRASRNVELDFFVLFSSMAGALGNPGQADYAAANGFMDQFAAYRNRQAAGGQRHGRTRSINWPMWQAGGMGIDAASRELLQQTTGMQPMQTTTGIDAFHRSLALPYDEILVVEGDVAQIRRALLEAPAPPAASGIEPTAITGIDPESLAEKTLDYLRRQLSELLKVPALEIDPRAPLENYGIDSILAMKLTNQLEKTFGSLSKTLFFEYQTIRQLAEYFIAHHSAQLTALLAPAVERPRGAVPSMAPARLSVPAKAVRSRRAGRQRSVASAAKEADPIAIIGLSGRYPEAVDIEAYWENLRDGKDCIVEVPRERWDWREHFSEDRHQAGRHYSKWGGFIAGVDEFDPLFFNISPAEAELMDPQERLFLQHSWMALEDAGYTRASVQVASADDLPGQVGVYVGVMYTEYQLFGVEASAQGKSLGIAGSAASIANRVSYVLNLHGPSMTLDTMCSSSLTAIHVACQDLQQGRTSLGIAGGVNVTVHPNKYLVLSAGQFISSDGACQSFGEGGDGYIPGEGVGVVVLKRLSEAKRDGDHIYGIIRGSALNHSGKTNGYTVPNPQAQSSAITRALKESHTDARHVSYIEAHGTGTKLGDPIEIAALSKAFHPYTRDTGFCPIGSAKSNIGHCESAAGIAGLTKVLLQMEHRQLVPSLHSAQLNPHIDFQTTPFVVNQELRPWEPPVIDGRTLPRIAGISSFGAGGSNAHMLVEEYQPPVRQPMAFAEVVILLSAKTAGQLREQARDLMEFIQPRSSTIVLTDVAYTLQVGREAMEERLGFLVSSIEQLLGKLQAFVDGEQGIEDVYRGQRKRNNETLSLFSTDSELRQAVDRWIAGRKHSRLLDLWVKGLEVDWSKLYGEAKPQRVSLPAYPFAKERYWVDVKAGRPVAVKGAAAAVLHPLLHSNTSDLSEQRYSSTFTGDEFFLADHQIKMDGGEGRKVLPGVAYLEMARAAIENALPVRPESMVLELRNTVWAQPIVVSGKQQVHVALLGNDDDQIDFEIYTREAGTPIVHCQGRAVLSHVSAPAAIDLAQLESQMEEGRLEPAGVYAACARMGLAYGPSFQGITGIARGRGQVLAQLRLPDTVSNTSADYVLHPSVMDAALQAAIGLIEGEPESDRPRLPFALQTLRVVAPCTPVMAAWVRYAAGSQAGDSVVRLDADLCDPRGNVCVQMHGLSSRLIGNAFGTSVQGQSIGSILAVPVWRSRELEETAAAKAVYAEHHVLLLELPDIDADRLAAALPHGRCRSLPAAEQENIAQRYGRNALACFEQIQTILQSKPRGRVLVQVVVAGHQEQAVLAGLSGLLKTAALENPLLAGQVIFVSADTTTEELVAQLSAEQAHTVDAVVRYEARERQVLRWEEVSVEQEKALMAFKDRGVYLITGGLGGLGVLFAGEILAKTRDARVVLTGRSALGADKQALIDGLSAQPGRVTYRRVDLGDLDEVRQLIGGITEEHGRLDGILHSAGMIADGFLLKKSGAQFTEVLSPKVTGTFHLDEASRDVELDFMVLFSSIAGALGNPGQADYAAANGFMDQFAAYRNRQVAAGQRHGRTRSINWPLWQAGGMSIDPAGQELLQQTTGIQPMQTATGMDAFHRSLALHCDQMLVVEGELTQVRRLLFGGPALPAQPQAERSVPAVAIDTESIAEKTLDYLRQQLSGLLKMPPHRIDPQAALETYGIDSVLAMKLTNQMEKTFGSLSKTLFFEYQTIRELTDYFVAHHATQLTALLAPVADGHVPSLLSPTLSTSSAPARLVSSRRFSRTGSPAPGVAGETDPVAIIGLSGRYPEAVDIEAYWDNLRDGKDCIVEVPKERWDWREYFSEERGQPGHHSSKWGGFIAGVDEFDPLFFNISPLEAELIDPQERLFLQHAWMAMEDAGYTRAGMQVPHAHDLPGQVGVYAGVMYNEYQLFGAEASVQGKRMGIPGSPASIANRVSYALNLHGPSMTLDTMCSSSLTAIHIACLELKLGRTSMAIAGGVNVSIHPNKYLVLSAGQFISGDGSCQSFGEGGDGYIPGEGVGVVVLKRLSEAKRDGDHIYGIIRGSALTHGGKTNGYTVPNPRSQTSAISRALAESNTDARHVSYIEAHGTGTKLGDPIEIAALSTAFHQYTQETGYCLIGSAKSNIGHCESAAGIAGLTKVLLQMKHQQVVPSLHSAQLNPHIDFDSSPFVVNQSLKAWARPVIDGRTLPRIAGISSFGAGGSNAHMIIEEYQPPATQPVVFAKVVILLSARTPEQLRERAGDLLAFVRTRIGALDLMAMAYTLQDGREPMEERLGFVATSAEHVVETLEKYLAGESAIDVYLGQVKRNHEALSVFSTDADLQQTIDKWIANRKLSKLLDLWVKGLEIDWSKLYGEVRPQRISLPVYPFAKEHYWIDLSGAPAATRSAAAAVLHPLLHSNTSDLGGQRYRSTFTGDEFFLAGHQVKLDGRSSRKVLPGVAYLEMVRTAIEHALPEWPEPAVLELRDTVWLQPLVVDRARQLDVAIVANDGDRFDYEVYSHDGDGEILLCQGRALLSHGAVPARLDLDQLEARMGQGSLEPSRVYAACARMGLAYGPAFRGIVAVHQGSGEVLAQLRLPASVAQTSEEYFLHPSLMDSALQAAIGLTGNGLAGDGSELLDQPRLPFALDSLRIVSRCTPEMFAWVRYAPGSRAADPVVRLDIDLADASGNVCVQMRGLSSRLLSREIGGVAAQGETTETLLAVPLWQASAVEASAVEYAEHHIVLCQLSRVDAGTLGSLIPNSRCLSLQFGQPEDLAQRYSHYALACFERIQSILRNKPNGRVLVQIVIDQEMDVLAGLSGLLKTAALENPRFAGQLVLAPAETTTEELAAQLSAELSPLLDAVVRSERGIRQVLSWEEIRVGQEKAPLAFKDHGVYLITGGLGGLGVLFAREILTRTREARVVLTGRSELSTERQELLDGLPAQAGRVSYRRMDLTDIEQVTRLIAAVRSEHGQLDGILHSAGMIADDFIVRKTAARFADVLAPKVSGTFNLDEASRDVELDFFVLFSSIAGALGNAGQAGYAAANGFMDQFAAHRNRQVASGERHGRTRSIDWPLWEAGGMSMDPASQALLKQTTGMRPMQTESGIDAFYRCLALPYDQILVVEGNPAQIRRALLAAPALPDQARVQIPAGVEIDAESLAAKTQAYLRKQFSELLKLPSHKIDTHAALEQYGIDSILAMKLTSHLEKTFGPLSKTLFFEYQTIAALAGYFVKAHPSVVREEVGLGRQQTSAKTAASSAMDEKRPAPSRRPSRALVSRPNHQQDIAIVGLSGRYPQAENLQEFWRNLQSGRDCITEVPPERWDHSLYFDADQTKVGKSYSKWGGFIDDVDKFDPLFFNISPKEAALIDPQERLFLQTAWEAIEDAGYSKESTSGKRVGVYVGVMWGQYELFGAEAVLRGNGSFPGSSYASIANRVSYFFDFHGPSIALDTMCSSSLTAIHMACEELRKGEIEAAIAGGVNVTIHPYKYLSLSQGKFVASDGRCRSFGEGGDGYVPGEGVGAVLLKRLEDALRDGDQVYAVIKSSTINHGGKTNGYSVPNPNAQGDLIIDALRKANVDPSTLSYVETHGTGTSLGDPIEITGLLKAFEGSAAQKQCCPIGSVKSNIGHLESAAGIAAVTKAVLQIKYGQLVPSLHADPPNPNIDFGETPFYVQTELTDWKHSAARPRRVGVSSFGAGGANAHLILEDYGDGRELANESQAIAPEAFVLSARDEEALVRYAGRMADFLLQDGGVSLANLAYTSQVGRTPMSARLAIIASSIQDLRTRLNLWIALRKGGRSNTADLENVFHGNLKEAAFNTGNLIEGAAGRSFLENLLMNRDLEKITMFWTLGVDIDWSLMHRPAVPRRVSLPTYPFAKERCWIDQGTLSLRAAPAIAAEARKVAAPEQAEEKQRMYYRPQESLKSLPAAERRPVVGPILLLDVGDGLAAALNAELQNDSANGPVVVVKPGKAFQEIEPNVFVLDPEQEEQFRELVETLESRSFLPELVLHLWAGPCRFEDQPKVTQQLHHSVYTLLYLCRALMRQQRQAPLRIISAFSGIGEAAAPLAAATAGFFKTLTLENPRYLGKVVEFQESGETSIAQNAGLLLDEFHDSDWMSEVSYRTGLQREHSRSVRGFVPFVPASRDAHDLPLRQKGVYLLTGGLGGLGFIFGEYLARNFQARLVLVGRSPLTPRHEERIEQLRGFGADVLYLRADVSEREDMQRVVQEAKARFSEIHGVIHGAGVNRDAFIARKTKEEVAAVLAPKVHGAINLDLATSGENLDLFILFSSVAGVMGNFGQCDYAYANRFLDSFAGSREKLRAAGRRSGRTLSIDWPLWEEGGMSISPGDIARLEEQTGICPLPAPEGIRFMEDFLRSDLVEGVALYGFPSRIAAYLAQKPVKVSERAPTPVRDVDPATLAARTEAYLKALIGKELELLPERIGSSERLESFGIDSVMINRLNATLERDLGALPKTMFYEHETVAGLTRFLLHEVSAALTALFGAGSTAGVPVASWAAAAVEEEPVHVSAAEKNDAYEPIAIIGIHGYYPHSANLSEYWENLKNGRNLIDLVPPGRWNYEELYDADPAAASDGRIYCKWGGFLDDHDKFDPHFFNISTEEARMTDPQERLFLESVWAAIEDAGYTRESLKKRFPKAKSADVGVFAGVTTNSYNLLSSGEGGIRPSAMPWSIANRVSYFCDFNGPSMPVDTACSSSLVAVHLACESLRSGECQVAIAGGVNLYLHPSKYQSLCQRRMLSLDGKTHSFGAGDDGFVPGEGVGSVVLKRLSRAIADGDHIHAVIPGSAYEHAGRSNGYSAPNPSSQANLISRTLVKAGIHPESISYVEGHGTGTQLGDSLEVTALTQAFRMQTADQHFCSIGSVKANLGHSESAAGMAGLAKVILQIKHRQLAPSIDSDAVNPNIEFEGSPFYLQHGLSEWESSSAHPRRALINSFGAGGVNACLVVEEYENAIQPEEARFTGPFVFTLSAKNEERLRDYAKRLLAYLREDEDVELADLCYTLQTGREAMKERLALDVTTIDDLISRLGDWSKGGSPPQVHRGSLDPRKGLRHSQTAVGDHSPAELAAMWVAGDEVDWKRLYPLRTPRRIALPTYPFARERYWVSDSPAPEKTAPASVQLHPLLSYNSSTIDEVSFSTILPDTAFYAVDHKVNGESIFPGAGFVEMACISGNVAGKERVRKIKDIVWIRPLSFRTGSQTLRTTLKRIGESVEYVIASLDDESENVVHSEGRLELGRGIANAAGTEDRVSLGELRLQSDRREEGEAFYEKLAGIGLQYGPAFRTVQEMHINSSFALAKLKIADHLQGEFRRFILHPSLIDGALQTVAGLVGDLESPAPHLPFALDEIEILRPLPQTCYAYARFAGPHANNHSGVKKFDIQLLNERGEVLIRFRNLYVRPLARPVQSSSAAAAQSGRSPGRLLSLSRGASND